MGVDNIRVNRVAGLLDRLRAYCDTGFALAIHIRYTRPSLLYRTYAQGWIDHYSEKGFMLTDPVVRWGLTHVGAVDWADLAAQDEAGVIADAAAHGLFNGLTHGVGPANSRTISGLTRSTGPFNDEERAELAEIVVEIHAATEGIEHYNAETLEALRALG